MSNPVDFDSLQIRHSYSPLQGGTVVKTQLIDPNTGRLVMTYYSQLLLRRNS
jgi:hypothetical protein